MLLSRAVRPFGWSLVAAAVLLTCLAGPAAAQDPADPNPGAITISGGLDFTNAYMFRGIRQETEGLIMWPYLDVALALYTGEGSLRSFGVNFGTWNSLHAGGDTGTQSPSRKLWYESDFYTTFSFGLPGGVTTGLTYTAYTSPNNMFTSIKEIAFKVSVDDSMRMGKFALKPYGLIAAEMDTSRGAGQADGGQTAGTYAELGIAPGYTAPLYSVAVPVKVGLSLRDYYEAPGDFRDSTFGYGSVAGIVTVPFTSGPTKFGQWNLHGGVEFQKLGGAARKFLGEYDLDSNGNPELNDDGRIDYKAHKFIYTLGLGFTY